jgi:hypothetical protein
MNKLRILAGILAFGSIWGLSESYIGSALSDAGFPSGSIMTGVFALSFLLITRLIYKQPGMQLGMGIVAGSLKLFNPLMTGCYLCSGIAIMAEGMVFESVCLLFSNDLKELKSVNLQISLGIITGYLMFITGNIVTQIITPLVQGFNFYMTDLAIFMPRILARGILPAIMGAAIVPLLSLSIKIEFKLKDTVYYPTTIGIFLLSWLIVVGNFLLS